MKRRTKAIFAVGALILEPSAMASGSALPLSFLAEAGPNDKRLKHPETVAPNPGSPKVSAQAGRTTFIEHRTGDWTVVQTDKFGQHNVTRKESDGTPVGGGQYGSGRSHESVVRDNMRSGSRTFGRSQEK